MDGGDVGGTQEGLDGEVDRLNIETISLPNEGDFAMRASASLGIRNFFRG